MHQFFGKAAIRREKYTNSITIINRPITYCKQSWGNDPCSSCSIWTGRATVFQERNAHWNGCRTSSPSCRQAQQRSTNLQSSLNEYWRCSCLCSTDERQSIGWAMATWTFLWSTSTLCWWGSTCTFYGFSWAITFDPGLPCVLESLSLLYQI